MSFKTIKHVAKELSENMADEALQVIDPEDE